MGLMPMKTGESNYAFRRFTPAVFVIVAAIWFNPSTAIEATNPKVRLTTDAGEMVIELDSERAPITIENFLQHVDNFFYDGVIFHRVIEKFIIQAGPYTFDLYEKETAGDPIVNESNNRLKNLRGTIALARTNDPDSARVHFFINIRDNPSLDAKADKPGYTVFGKVIKGMQVVDAISKVKTHRVGVQLNLPVEPIRILKARRVEQ